jgi:hypothetical protein
VDLDQTTSAKEITLPTADAIWNCTTINKLKNLENQATSASVATPSMTVCRSNQRQSNKAGGAGGETTPTVPIATLMFKETTCFIPAPFIIKEFFGGVPIDPLDLILTVKQAVIYFNNTHSASVGFENDDATIQAKRFEVWAYAVFKDYIEEASFEVEPDNNKLQKYLDKQHSKCILPSLPTLLSGQTSTSNCTSILEQLGAGLTQMSKANKAANVFANRHV